VGERPQIGVVVIQGRPFAELRTDWQRVDEAGFHSLWVFDHLMKYPIMGVLLEAWTTIAAMAMCTERIRIGALVTNITFRNPAVLAKEAVTIDHLSNGRLEIGIGAAGTREDDALVTGSVQWPVAERVERFDEFVELVKLTTRGASDYDGRYYRCENFDRGPWPVQDEPPITVAAHGRKTLRIAAKHADTWSASAGFGRAKFDLFPSLQTWNSLLDDFALEAGRDPKSIRRSLLIGPSGSDWWSSQDALDDFVGRSTAAGMTDLVFTYPAPTGDFIELVKPYL
jgi:alkanesulfonate monooxygenase SsuD/methylene tetrahydromethanopterin reductase-like flavin-dependent oxidoreductase (luciferase family)